MNVSSLFITLKLFCIDERQLLILQIPASDSTIILGLFFVIDSFYRAMHFSAKRGIAIACRLSVCPSVRPSVTLVDLDHIGRKSWKLTERTISPTPSLFVAQSPPTYSQGNMGKFWGD